MALATEVGFLNCEPDGGDWFVDALRAEDRNDKVTKKKHKSKETGRKKIVVLSFSLISVSFLFIFLFFFLVFLFLLRRSTAVFVRPL